jgi:hypothetical protein
MRQTLLISFENSPLCNVGLRMAIHKDAPRNAPDLTVWNRSKKRFSF